MTRWDKARQRQQQAPRRYRACGPVGDAHNHNAPECQACNMHVCSCPEPELPPCPPCPNCGHYHRFSACGLCACKSERPTEKPHNNYWDSIPVSPELAAELKATAELHAKLWKRTPLLGHVDTIDSPPPKGVHLWACAKHNAQGWDNFGCGCPLCAIEPPKTDTLDEAFRKELAKRGCVQEGP